MAIRTLDYPTLRLEYVGGSMSLRELCRRHNIPDPSAVIKMARREGWARDRDEVRSRSNARVFDRLAEREASRALRVAEVTDNAVELVDEAISQVRTAMKTVRQVVRGVDAEGNPILEEEPILKMTPRDLVKLIATLPQFASEPRMASAEPQTIGISVPSGTDFAIMARFVKEVRERGGPRDEPFDASRSLRVIEEPR